MRRLLIGLVSVAACAVGAPVAAATSASVAITGGDLTVSTPSVRVISQSPTELDVTTTVTDARGTGSGWFVSLAASAPSSASLVVTGADAACLRGSDCTLPVNAVGYPLTVGLTGARTTVYQANSASGLGAQSVNLHVLVPPTVRSGLNFGVSVSTEPLPGGATPSPPCSIAELLSTGTCPQTP